MSERLSPHHEQSGEQSHEIIRPKEVLREDAEKKAETHRHEHAEKLDDIRSLVEKTARSKHEHETPKHERENHEHQQPALVNKELKEMAYRRTLKRVQTKLPAPARTLSKVIHNPAVEAASELAGKTIARPSGILAGGITAFLGSSVFLWVARHYGYEYNFLLFAFCFIAGFGIGLLVELGVKLATRRGR